MSDDPLMDRITAAIGKLHSGDKQTARIDLAGIWQDMGEDADPFHVCVLSHYMADLQEDLADELEWDRRALVAADRVSDDRAKRHHASLSIKSFYPSLHLNLGDALLRSGQVGEAREQLRLARAASQDLMDTPLGQMTLKGIEGLEVRIEQAERETPDPS